MFVQILARLQVHNRSYGPKKAEIGGRKPDLQSAHRYFDRLMGTFTHVFLKCISIQIAYNKSYIWFLLVFIGNFGLC